jgi:hypothetical protein
MTEKTDANSLGAALHDRADGLPTDRGVSRPVRAALYVPCIRHGRGAQASGARGRVRQDAVRPQQRAPDYRLVAARPDSCFLRRTQSLSIAVQRASRCQSCAILLVSVREFALGMAIHNEALAEQQTCSRSNSCSYSLAGINLQRAVGLCPNSFCKATSKLLRAERVKFDATRFTEVSKHVGRSRFK